MLTAKYLRAVRRGQPVVIYDRDTPVARLIPYVAHGEPVTVQPASRPLHSTPLPAPLGRSVNSFDVLLEERQSGR